MFGRKNSSSNIAKERLKLVLIHDRAGTSPSSNVIETIRREIYAVLSKYFEVVESDFEVEIKNASELKNHNQGMTRLTADIPIQSIKNMGRNR